MPRQPHTIASYRHVVPAPPAPAAEADLVGNFYVYATDPTSHAQAVNPQAWGVLVGPFLVHREAIDLVDACRDEAERADPRAVFYRFGTVNMRESYRRPGPWNARMGVTPTAPVDGPTDSPAP